MKNILLFPAQITYPFFENEIDYVKENFNIAAVFDYGDEREAAENVLRKHGISSDKLYIIPHVRTSILKGRLNPFRLLIWLHRKEVRKEIKEKCFKGHKKIKKLLQVIQYGGYALLAEKIVASAGIDSDSLCLYSFWMATGAYTLAYLKNKGYFPDSELVCRAHGGDLYEEREDNELKYIPFRSYINENMDRISFISEQGKDYFTARFPQPDNKFISYLGTKNENHIHKEITKKNGICIASCSNVIEVKRLDLIISAMAHLNGLNVRWIHLGDGPLLDNMKTLAEEKLAGTTVRYEFLGFAANSEILNIYKKYDADFLINLSDSEGLPVSIMEAFSMGIPVIARNVGGTGEIVDNETGLLLEAEWTDGNYDKIRSFVKCRTERQAEYSAFSEKSLAVWHDKFNADKNYTEFFKGLAEMRVED